MDSHSYEEALPYGQSLLKKDPFDGAGIRYGVLSTCAVLGKSRIALNTAKKIVEPLIDDETKKKWDKIPIKEARDTAWLLEAEPVLVYLLSMAYWKENKPDKAKETIAAMLGWLKGQGGRWLDQFIDLTASVEGEEDYMLQKKKLEAEYNPDSAGAFLACVDVPFEVIRDFNKWLAVALYE